MIRTITNPAFSAKDPGEIVTLAFDFANLTTTPLTPTVACTWHAGEADAAPSAVLSGSPSVSTTKVLQQVKLGTAGTDYLLRCEIDTADGSHYVLAGVLPVRAA